MRSLAHGIEKIAGGMILGIAHNGYADAETGGSCALRDSFGGVVGPFGVNVRTQVVEQSFDIGFVKKQHVIDGAQCGDQSGARRFRKNWAPGTFQSANTGVGVHGNHQDVTFAGSALEIADVADMQGVEATIGQDNFLAAAAVLREKLSQAVAHYDFGFGKAHRYVLEPPASRRIVSRSSARETVAVPRFITTRPPAILAIWAASSGEAPQARAKV